MTNIFAFDLETTGIDVFNDRIVTAAISELSLDGAELGTFTWLADPGVEIPEGASEVHGITTEYAREHGDPAIDVVKAVLDTLRTLPDGAPMVIYNANYDVSLLHYEALRHGLIPEDFTRFNLIDPLTLDRHLDKYRRGSRKLVDVARHYGVDVDEEEAHDAAYDNYLAGNVAIALVRKFKVTNNVLKEQASMYRAWAEGFEAYLRKKDPTATVDKEWPLRKEDV